MNDGIEWRWKSFASLTREELYELLRVRQEVFVVEQAIACVDADGRDPQAWHLLGYDGADLVAYLRAFAPGIKYPSEASLGRVLTTAPARGTGVGRALIRMALLRCDDAFAHAPIRISAQAYLRQFYASFGFAAVGEPYVEEGLPHLQMLRPGPTDRKA